MARSRTQEVGAPISWYGRHKTCGGSKSEPAAANRRSPVRTGIGRARSADQLASQHSALRAPSVALERGCNLDPKDARSSPGGSQYLGLQTWSISGVVSQPTLDLTGCQRKRTHWRWPQREGFGGAARGRTIRWHPQHLTRFTPLLPRDAIYNRPTLDELPAGAERAAKGRRWRMAQAQQGRGLPYKPSTEGQLRNPAGRTARRGVLSPEV